MMESNRKYQLLPETILGSIAEICWRIAQHTTEFENALISDIELNAGEIRANHIIQSLDLIIQSIQEVSLLLEKLDGDILAKKVEELDSITEVIKLEWIRDALLGDDIGDSRPESGNSHSGTILF